MKLLYNLTRLWEGTPLQPLRLHFFGIGFPSHPCSQLPISHFSRAARKTEQGERRAGAHERAPLPNLSTPDISRPTPYTNYPTLRQAPRRAAPFRNAAGGMFPSHCTKYFIRALTLFFLCYFRDLPRSSHPLKAVTLNMKDL